MNAPAPAARPIANSYWVRPGRLLAGEHPGGNLPEQTEERLRALLAAGVECFIDLTLPRELPPYDALLPLSIEYLRKPIRDHGLPERRAHMAEILDCIEDALRAGRVVYVHCRAGIGRTGTVIGCWLVEQGLAGEAALDTLNTLWTACERSASWPFVPETPEQADFVRNWTPRQARRAGARSGAPPQAQAFPVAPVPPADPPRQVTEDPSGDALGDPQLLEGLRLLRDRFAGAMVGLAVGDAMAAATQYRRPGSFPPVGDLLGGGPFDLPRGAWSDDTAMALCLAESLLERGFDPRDQVERYQRWQAEGHLSATGECLGITASTARALGMARWRRQPFAGTHDPAHQDPEVLSRVAPVVLHAHADPERAVREAAEAARTTCQASVVGDACRALARALLAALGGAPREAVLAAAASAARPPPRRGSASRAADATASGALQLALEAFATSTGYRDAVLRAANGGGNSDVVATVCGQLAGAFYGVDSIPPAWRQALARRELIEQFAERLLAHALAGD